MVNAIKGSNGNIGDEIAIRKVLRTLLPIYAIRVSIIQELRCTPSNNLNLESFKRGLIAFEMFNFDNFTPTIEVAFSS